MQFRTDTTSLKQALNAITETYKDADTKLDFAVHLFHADGVMKMTGKSPSDGFTVWMTIPNATGITWTKPVAVNGKVLREELKAYRKKVEVDVEIQTETELDISSDEGDVLFIPLLDDYMETPPQLKEVAVVPKVALSRMLEQLNVLPITTFHPMSKAVILEPGKDTLHGTSTNLCQINLSTLDTVNKVTTQGEIVIPDAMVTKLIKVLGRSKEETATLLTDDRNVALQTKTSGIVCQQAESVTFLSVNTRKEMTALADAVPVGTVDLKQWEAVIVAQKKIHKQASDAKENKDTLADLDRVYVDPATHALSQTETEGARVLPLKELANVMKKAQNPLRVSVKKDRMVLVSQEVGYENTTLFPLM